MKLWKGSIVNSKNWTWKLLKKNLLKIFDHFLVKLNFYEFWKHKNGQKKAIKLIGTIKLTWKKFHKQRADFEVKNDADIFADVIRM